MSSLARKKLPISDSTYSLVWPFAESGEVQSGIWMPPAGLLSSIIMELIQTLRTGVLRQDFRHGLKMREKKLAEEIVKVQGTW